MGNFQNKVYEAIKKIPEGKVCTYGEIAKVCGKPKCGRIVGYIVWRVSDLKNIPVYRIVNREGELTALGKIFNNQLQSELLEKEKIEVKDNKVDLKKYGYYFNKKNDDN